MEEREQRLLQTLLQDLCRVFQRTGLPGPCQIPLPEPFQAVRHSGEPPPSSPIEHIERLIPVSAQIHRTVISPTDAPLTAYRYPLKALSVASDDLMPKPEDDLSGYLREDYRHIWRSLTEAMEHLRQTTQFESYFFTLYFLFKRYLARIPSVQAADTSMFDHARIASAIDDCRYLYHKEKERKKAAANVSGGKGGEELKPSLQGSEGESKPEHTDEEKEFLLIGGELSGIQRFFCAPTASQQDDTSQINVLRGRSLYLLLLAETLAEYLLKALDLKIVHQLWCTGGQFLILAANIPAITYHLKACYHDINDFLIKKFRGDLSFALSSLPVSYQMLHARFDEPYRELQRLLQREHTRPFCSVLQEHALVQFPASAAEDDFAPEHLGQRLADLHGGGGRLVMKVKAATESWRGDPLVKFEIGKTRHIAWDVNPEEDAQIENIYSVNTLEMPLARGRNVRSGFKLLPIYTDEQATDETDGLLGVLQLDLGTGCTRKTDSLTKMAAFRADRDLFLTGHLQHLCQTTVPQHTRLLHVGSDDLCVVGDWRQMVMLACQIYEDFTTFTCGNPNLSISGAIFVCTAQYPLCRAIEQAGLQLNNLAKESLTGAENLKGQRSTRNALAIFNHRLPWKDLLTLRDAGDRLAEAIRNRELPRRTLYALLELHRTWKTNKTLNTARMYYLTANTIQNVLCRNLLLAQHHYLANPSYIPMLVRYVALQTRSTQSEVMSAPDASQAPDALT